MLSQRSCPNHRCYTTVSWYKKTDSFGGPRTYWFATIAAEGQAFDLSAIDECVSFRCTLQVFQVP